MKSFNVCMKFYYLFILFIFGSCRAFDKERVSDLVEEWYGKEILFPSHSTFTVQGIDTVGTMILDTQYKIVTYVDSTGCTGCKLQLPHWKSLIDEIQGLKGKEVSFLFYFHPKINEIKELKYIVRNNNFTYPICLDDKDEFNRCNKLLNNVAFQTFLLDKDNKIMAIGNPIHNSKVKELYMNIILGNSILEKKGQKTTTVHVDKLSINLGRFNWKHEVQTEFILSNTGINPLVIMDVTTSCGCTPVEYDKKPVRPGGKLKLIVKYKADEPGHFSKSIKVFCNADESPLSLRITGEALSD